MCHRGANAWRSLVQTLLVAAGCGGVLGLLPGRFYRYPGSPRLGSAAPGLNYATPLGLVSGGAEGGKGCAGVMCHRGANAWRSLVQALLVDVGCGGVLGLLSGRFYRYPGSPRLGSADPGLNYATPLGLVWRGVVGRKVAAVEGGGFARGARCVSCASDWRVCGERYEERGRNMGAGIATRCESVWERDVRQRGVSLRSTPRYRLRWLRHPELKRGFDNCHRSKGYQWTAIVTHQCRGGLQNGN